MAFIGRLNFPNPRVFGDAEGEELAALMRARMDQPVEIGDARAQFGVQPAPMESQSELVDGRGFLLTTAPSRVANFWDASDVRAHYYAETRAVVERLLPDAEVWPIDSHTARREAIDEHHWVDGVQFGPCVAAVHNDYADFVAADGRTIERRFSEVMGMPSDRRVIGLNLWRSVGARPLERWPLAICDRTSIEVEDLEYDINAYAGAKPFNAHFCRPNPGQRWYYFPRMKRDEVLVFLTYDSHPSDGDVFRPTLHSAVDLPGSASGSPRESVEVRFFAALPLPNPR